MYEVKNILSARFAELLSEKGIKASQLAADFGVSKSYISRIINGQRAMSIEMLMGFADYFNVSLDYLVGRSDDPTISK